MFKLFSKKKKFSAHCELSRQPVDRESAYLLSTAQVISSRKFWDSIMTEPDTMSYTEAHFKTGDQTAANIRNMIFKKYAKEDKVWVISDSHIHLFEVDPSEAKQLANQWWDSQGNEIPLHLTTSIAEMDDQHFEEIRRYAIQDAGRAQVKG